MAAAQLNAPPVPGYDGVVMYYAYCCNSPFDYVSNPVEVLITPGCKMVGRSLGALRLRRRYGVYPLAVHRRNQNIGRQLDDLVVTGPTHTNVNDFRAIYLPP